MRKAISESDPHRRGGDPAVERWLSRTLAIDPPRAKSLIVTIWGDALAPHGGTLWLSELIGLLRAFDISERTVRTSVFRLAAEGWLRGEARGRQTRYRVTMTGERAFADAYRRIYFPHADDWGGEWQLVIAPPESLTARERVALRNAFAWNGFGALAPGVFARPRAAHGDRVPASAPILSRLTVLAARDDDRVSGAPLASSASRGWDLRGLAATWRTFLARFGRAIDQFRGSGKHAPDPRQCFVARTLLIHAFRRVLLRDPLLPPALLPLDWPGAAAYALTRDFYRLVYRPADAYLGTMLGADFGAGSDEFHRRFGGLD